MKKRGRNLVILACVLAAAVFSACFLDAMRNNPNDPKADNYKGIQDTPKEWKPAVRIDAQNVDAFFPAVAIDNSGNSYALWTQPAPNVLTGLYSRKYSNNGTGWGNDATAVVLISSDYLLTGGVKLPKVSMEASGEAAALWYHEVTPGMQGHVYGNCTEGGNWTSPDPFGVADIDNMNLWENGLAVGGGKAIAVFSEVVTEEIDPIHSYRYSILDIAAKDWGPDILLGGSWDGMVFAYDIKVAMNPDGKAVAIWREQNMDPAYFLKASLFDGTAWAAAENIETDPVEEMRAGIDVAMTTTGEALAVWSVTDAAIYQIKGKRYNGTAWGDAEIINENSAVWQDCASMAMDPTGKYACVIWRQDEPTAFAYKELHASTYGYGANTWSPAVRIDQINTNVSEDISVAIDAFGNIVVVWKQDIGMEAGNHIYSCRYTSEGSWSDPAQLDTAADHSINPETEFGPAAAVSEAGYATVVWCQLSGGTRQTWAARYEDIAKK